MKRILKKMVISCLVAAVIAAGILPAGVSAAKKDNFPSKVRMFYVSDEGAIEIELADEKQSIGNIKTSSKDLFAMLTGSEYSYERLEGGSSITNQYTIGLYGEKDGTYTVSFDILDENNKKVSTKKVLVYKYPSPVKSVTMNGKLQEDNWLSEKSAKVKVSLSSGNKIQKLEYGVYEIIENEGQTRSEIVYKTFKNGSSVTFGTQSYYYANDYTYENEGQEFGHRYFNTGIDCPTYIRVVYYDKYTKQNEAYVIHYYRWMK